MANNDIHHIGLDIGDGESCLAYVASNSLGEPSVYRSRGGSGSIPSAIAYYKHGLKIDVVIGEEAFLIEDRTDLDINFKWDPVAQSEQWMLLKDKLLKFVETLFKEFSRKYPKIAENCEMYIGCPSGWSDEVNGSREIYERLFRGSEILPPSLTVVPESRSALIQAMDFKLPSSDPANARILLIDIGSSTTDVTAIDCLKPREIEVGTNLGLRQVDERLFETVCKTHSNGDMIAEKVKAKVDNDMLLYTCRLARERAFGRTVDPSKLFRDRDWLKDCWQLLVSFELTDCLQGATFWNDKPWLERYRSLLRDLQRKVGNRDMVIVTGGGSNIPILVEEAEAAFPRAFPVRDSEPAFSVARGLAGYGRWRKRVEDFRREAMALVRNALSSSEFTSECGPFFGKVARLFTQHNVEAIWRPMAYQWVEGTLNLRNREEGLHAYALQLYRKWLDAGNQCIFESALTRLSDSVNCVLSDDVRDLGKRYGLPVDSFKIELRLSPLELFGPQSPGEIIIEKAVWGVQEVFFRMIDHMPEWVRKVAHSSGALDGALKFETLTKGALGTLSGALSAANVSEEMRQRIASFVLDAAKSEVNNRLIVVEQLLLESHRS